MHNFLHEFLPNLPTSKEQWNFIKQKISPSKKNVKVDEIWLEIGEMSREPKNIVNCLNRSFVNLGVFKVSNIACKYADKLNITEFKFRTVTWKELYTAFDSLDDNKAAGLGEISIRLIKSCILAIGVHLEFSLNECIKGRIFPTKMKLNYLTPIFKNGDKLDSTNYHPISVTPSFKKHLSASFWHRWWISLISIKFLIKNSLDFRKKVSDRCSFRTGWNSFL